MLLPVLVLLVILVLLGVGGFALHLLWYALVIAFILWLIGFFLTSAGGGGRWYRW